MKLILLALLEPHSTWNEITTPLWSYSGTSDSGVLFTKDWVTSYKKLHLGSVYPLTPFLYSNDKYSVIYVGNCGLQWVSN